MAPPLCGCGREMKPRAEVVDEKPAERRRLNRADAEPEDNYVARYNATGRHADGHPVWVCPNCDTRPTVVDPKEETP